MRILGGSFLVLLTLLAVCGFRSLAQTPSAKSGLRQPIALALVDHGKRLLVANRESGTLALVDTGSHQILTEHPVGRKLSSLAVVGERVLVSDEAENEIILLLLKKDRLFEKARRKVGFSPVSVLLSEDGRLASVACLWPRQMYLLDLDQPDRPAKILDLPFAPRRQLLVPGTGKVVVADSFAGGLAVLDLKTQTVESTRTLAAVHNIRGLAVDRRRENLILTHQTLHAQGHSNAGDIRSGNLIANNLHLLSLARVFDPLADLQATDRLYSLGDVEKGAGDPADVVETSDGSVLVAFAGVNELGIGQPEKVLWNRLDVGQRPTALVLDDNRHLAYLANTFGDSLSVVDIQRQKVLTEIHLGPPIEDKNLTPAQRGERLFYDARLSFESWFSCNSCHVDGHTSGRLNDNLSDGSLGTPKRVLSLLGVKDSGPWAWNGNLTELSQQMRNSLKSTMQGKTPTVQQVDDLIAFLHTLPPAPSLAQARGKIDAAALNRGEKLFVRHQCGTCHTPPLYTSPRVYDVGIRDEKGQTRFNPPSLRGVSQGGPYFHDNRARNLEEVFERFHHPNNLRLTAEEIRDLLEYLRSL